MANPPIINTGNTTPFTATAAVTAGDVVVLAAGNGQAMFGISANTLAIGETGTLHIKGEAVIPKVSGAVMKQGENISWDVSAGEADDNQATAATGDLTGPFAMVMQDAGNGATTVRVNLPGIGGTIN